MRLIDVATDGASLRGYKGGSGGSQRQPVEAPDSLISIEQVRILDLIGEGDILGLVNGINSIYLDEAPGSSYPSLQWDYRLGTQDQSFMPGFPAVESEINVGVNLLAASPYVRAVTNITVTALRINFALGRFAQQNPSNGDTTGCRVEFAIDLAQGLGPFEEIRRAAFDGKTTTGYSRGVRVDLTYPAPAGGWRIRVRRITPDSTSSNVSDVVTIRSVTEIIDYKFRYPNSALVGLNFDAEAFGGKIPKRSYHIKGRIVSVPSNYDPAARSYTGIWDGSFKPAWTNNPVWVYYDLLLHPRYGLGDRITANQIDKWGLYEISQYCDQVVDDGKGGKEPRFTCNMFLQKQADALRVMQDLASVFRGITYWGLGQAIVSADMPRDPVYTYTNANVRGGRFDRKGSKKSTVYSVILSAWSDPNDFYRVKYEYVQDDALVAKYGVRSTTLANIGCTSQGQAHRAGKWALLTNKYETNTVTFSVGLEGIKAMPGQVVRIVDQHRQGRRVGGRVRDGSTTTRILVDMLPNINVAVGDVLALNMPDGKSADRVVSAIDHAQNAITVTAPYPSVPARSAVWAYESEDLKSELYRIVSVSEGSTPLEYNITALTYTEGKHEAIDFGTIISSRPTTSVPIAVVPPPENVRMSTDWKVDQAQAVTTLTIAWDKVVGAVRYDVEWRRDNADWVYAGRVATTEVDVVGIYAGTYSARVRAINAVGILSPWAEVGPELMLGKTSPPPVPVNVRTTSEIFAIRVDWGFPEGAEDTAFSQLQIADNQDGLNLQELGQLSYPTGTYLNSGMAAGILKWFRVRLIDKTGNVGSWSNWVNGRSSADADEILDYIKGQITESEIGKNLLDRIDLIDGDGPDSVNERLAETRAELDQSINQVNSQITELDQTVTGIKGDLDQVESDLAQAKEDLDQQILETNQSVTALRNDLQAQIDDIADLTDSMPYKPGSTYTAGMAVLGPNGILYQARQNVPINTPPPNATYWIDIGQVVTQSGALAARVQAVETAITDINGTLTAQAQQITGLQTSIAGKADNSVVQSLTSRVEQNEAGLSSQGQAITGLQTSLTTTNNNVTAAQTAAQNAADLAGSKGKVFFQTTAPAVADRLAQNLWIDTTGNANTPKRWNGTAWVAVTDKVATDAAAAAAAANALAQTKADASAVTALTTRVTNVEGTVSSQATSITNLQTSLTTTNNNVTAAQTAAQNAATLAGGKGKVIYGSSAPAVADRVDQNLWIDTTGNANTPKRWNGTAWVAVTDKVATDAAAAAAAANALAQTKADASAVTALSTLVTQQGNTLTSQGQLITTINASMGRVLSNSEKVYQSVFSGMSTDQWVNNYGGTGSSSAFSNVEGNTSGATLTASGGPNNVNWWGASTRKIRFDPTRLYKLSMRFKQLTAGKGSPVVYAGVDGFAEDGVTRINTSGVDSKDASHYVITGGLTHPIGEWVEFTRYVKGHTIGTEGGGAGAGTAADPKRLKTGIAWISPMFVSGYNNVGGDLAVDYLTIDDVTDVVKIDANAEATTALTTRVTNVEGTVSSQATSITNLQTSLTTTNNNVTAAQTAAQNAADLAGSKGKVFFQTTAPAVADRLAQNLWIDTTGNANTPKRWNGTAWVAVTDKVATDAAAAAAAANALAQTKADASAVTALSTLVTQQGNTLTSLGQSVTTINATIGRVVGNSEKVYQSIFTSLAVDVWERTGAVGPTEAFSNVAGNTSGATMTFDSSVNLINWWGGSTQRIRFDPERLYKLSARVIQISDGGRTPTTYLGLCAYSEDGTRLTNAGVPGNSSQHYVLASGVRLVTGEWTTFTAYVKGHAAAGTPGGQGGGTVDNPRKMVGNTAYISPMAIFGYSNLGGVAAMDYYTIEDVTEQVQIDNNAAATTALTARVSSNEGAITAQSQQITNLQTSVTGLGSSKADASAVTALTTRVTSVEGTLSSQSTLITNLQSSLSGLGASGVNLMPADYAVFGSSLPALVLSGSTAVSDPDPLAFNGYALKATTTTTSTTGVVCMVGAQTYAGANMPAQKQKYIVSFWARANVAGHQISTFLRSTNTSEVSQSSTGNPVFTLTTDWVRYSGVLDLSGMTIGADKMYLFFQPNRSGVVGRIIWIDRVMIESTANDVSTPSNFSIGNSAAATMANAAATTSLTARVTQTEQGLTSQASQITGLTSSLGDVGGENLVYNPSFDKVGTTPTVADGWWFDKSSAAVTQTASLVQSTMATGLAQRLDMAGLTSSLWVRVYAQAGRRFKVTPGTQYTASMYTRGTPGLRVLLQVYGVNASGTATTSWGSPRVDQTEDWQRLSFTFTPTAPTDVVYASFVAYGGANASEGFSEIDHYQIERGTVMTGWRDNGQVAATDTQANAAATTSLATRVTNVEGTVSSQATSITNLQTSLTTTNGNVTAAQNAAQAASDLAGGKGKVIYGTTAPAVADRLSQNLWIDTAGNANTPKRWNGTAWVAVTDKVATDAAAAAAAANALAATKADASAVTSLTSRVSDAEGKLTSQATSITNLQTSVGGLSSNVSALSSSVSTLDGKVSATRSIKVGVTANGIQYTAGYGVSLDNNSGVVQSNFVVLADRFSVMNASGNGYILPFVIQNGQVFISDALISKLTVQNAIIGSTLRSAAMTNWASGAEPVMTMDFNTGNVITRNNTRAQTYSVMNAAGIYTVVDGALRVRMGVW